MGDVDQNSSIWNESWDWSTGGDEWSEWWGGTPALWFGALLPRIHPFIPTGTILEIAPGYGRWTQYLKDACDQLVLVDLAEKCIDSCRRRFAADSHITYHVNDGRSLAMVADGSVDFVFSFDSLVHVEADVLESYLGQLARKLTGDGVGFIHHSNIGHYPTLAAVARRAPARWLKGAIDHGLLIDLLAWRAPTMTAERFAEMCRQAGLSCISQEKISWEHGPYLIDALTVFTPVGSKWDRESVVIRNPLFRQEADRMARLYARPGPPGISPAGGAG